MTVSITATIVMMGTMFNPLPETKIHFLERFGDSDMQDLAHEVLKWREVIRSLYGNDVDLTMFFKED